MNLYKPGLHILATFSAAPQVLTEMQQCKALFEKLILELELSKVGETYYSFDGGGFTATVCLTESHAAIHTWPEFSKATFDVFLSNFNKDNSEKVREFYDKTINYFNATDIQVHELMR
jgi:S-adenosylmethionine decarboxylase